MALFYASLFILLNGLFFLASNNSDDKHKYTHSYAHELMHKESQQCGSAVSTRDLTVWLIKL